jgi:hypothetical protein
LFRVAGNGVCGFGSRAGCAFLGDDVVGAGVAAFVGVGVLLAGDGLGCEAGVGVGRDAGVEFGAVVCPTASPLQIINAAATVALERLLTVYIFRSAMPI